MQGKTLKKEKTEEHPRALHLDSMHKCIQAIVAVFFPMHQCICTNACYKVPVCICAYRPDGELPRTLTSNMVVGVSKGFEKKLQLVGVGYRATVEGKELILSLGFSHPVKMTIPDDLKIKVEENTRITVSGYDKASIGQFAASIRKWRPPEPYKGKGVKYADEIVRRKEGKAGKKK